MLTEQQTEESEGREKRTRGRERKKSSNACDGPDPASLFGPHSFLFMNPHFAAVVFVELKN